MTATDTARPTPHAFDVLTACRQTGRTVAIVSNNSAEAIGKYLAAHNLTKHVTATVGRGHSPDLMKPSPHPIHQALRDLRAAIDETVLVGDSLSDIQAAHQTGIRSIGYANRPKKISWLETVRPDVIITSMKNLAESLRHTNATREAPR